MLAGSRYDLAVLCSQDAAAILKDDGRRFHGLVRLRHQAVECSVALQRAFAERGGEPLSVRVGLNAGEPIEEDSDLFGATVILASRIAAKAGGGEVLVADTVRGLCRGKGSIFADRGRVYTGGDRGAGADYPRSGGGSEPGGGSMFPQKR